MTITLNYTNILMPGEVIENGALVIADDGKILYAGSMEMAPRVEGESINLEGRYVAPGFIDVHVHGGNGISFGTTGKAADELAAYSSWVVCTGVTGYLCSLAAPDADTLQKIVSGYASAMQAGVESGAEPLGIHLEGPYLSKEKKGAFNPAWLRAPALEEVKAALGAGRGWIRQMTLAPELPAASDIAAQLRERGVVAALGHSNTDYETAGRALRGDFTHVTHTFNAQSGFHHREPGVFGAVMASEDVTAELIADTVHVHPGAMKVLLRCLGRERVVLITDAMAGAGLPDGAYELVGHKVIVRDSRATLENGTIAGSTASLNSCVRNIVKLLGYPLSEAVHMAALNPARFLGLDHRLGSIQVGKEASLVVIDGDVNVYMTFVRGKLAYRNL